MPFDMQMLTKKVAGVPVYAWAGGGIVVAGVGFLYLRRKKATGASTDQGAFSYPPVSYSGGSSSGYAPPSRSFLQPVAPITTNVTPGSVPTPAASPSSFGAQNVGGQQNLLGMFTVQNPVGSAAQDALNSINPFTGVASYAPSATDYLTERAGGVQTLIGKIVGSDPAQGLTYTQSNVDTGTGGVIPLDKRIPGERYDIYGRRIM